MLLLHGARDDIVNPDNSVRLASRITAAGGCARAVVLDGIGQVHIVLALAAPRIGGRRVMDEVARFVVDPAGAACGRRQEREGL